MAEIAISVAHGSGIECRARATLTALLAAYDLRPFFYTTDVVIDGTAVPHSHPRLTLGTGHADEPRFLLAEFVHEQLHWFEEAHAARRDAAIADSKALYPIVPVDRPEGCGSEDSTRLHLLVCHWEYQALKRLLGEAAGRDVIEALSRHHYKWVYRRVLDDEARIGRFIAAHDLVPEPLSGIASGGAG